MWRAHKKRKKKTACVCVICADVIYVPPSPLSPRWLPSFTPPFVRLFLHSAVLRARSPPLPGHTLTENPQTPGQPGGGTDYTATHRERQVWTFCFEGFFNFVFLCFPWEHFHSRFCNFSGRFSSHKSLPKPRGKKQLWRQGENDDIRPDIRTLELLIKKTNCAFLSCSSGLGTLLWTVSSRLLRWDEDEDEDEDRTVEEEEEV